MTTIQAIEDLKKAVYVMKLKKFDKEHIDSVERAIIILQNYMKSTKLYLDATKWWKIN